MKTVGFIFGETESNLPYMLLEFGIHMNFMVKLMKELS